MCYEIRVCTDSNPLSYTTKHIAYRSTFERAKDFKRLMKEVYPNNEIFIQPIKHNES